MEISERQIVAEAVQVVNLHPLGMLVTLDAEGWPQARWMAAAAVDGMRRLYTLTGRGSRKVEQVIAHPQVTWVFSSAACHDVVTAFGQARVLDAPIVSQGIWDQLASAARSYVMSSLSDERHLEFATIETQVERIELLSPRMKIFVPRGVALAPRGDGMPAADAARPSAE